MEHVTLINRIIEAEHYAQQIADDAREKLVALPEELKEQKSQRKQELFDRADRRIAAMNAREEELTAEKLAALDERYNKELHGLEELFKEHHYDWADRLFTMITDR